MSVVHVEIASAALTTHIQGRGAKKRTQRAGCSGTSGYEQKSPEPGGWGRGARSLAIPYSQGGGRIKVTPFAATHKIVGSLQFTKPRGPTEKRTKGVYKSKQSVSTHHAAAAARGMCDGGVVGMIYRRQLQAQRARARKRTHVNMRSLFVICICVHNENRREDLRNLRTPRKCGSWALQRPVSNSDRVSVADARMLIGSPATVRRHHSTRRHQRSRHHHRLYRAHPAHSPPTCNGISPRS